MMVQHIPYIHKNNHAATSLKNTMRSLRSLMFIGAAFAILLQVGCGSIVEAPSDEPDAGTQSTADAAPESIDAVKRDVFDIAYVSEVTITADTVLLDSVAVLVNRDNEPLDLAGITIESATANNGGVSFTPRLHSSTAILGVGEAAGNLSDTARQLLVDDGVVIEPITDTMFSLDYIIASPAGDYDIDCEIILVSGGYGIATLPLTIHRRSSGLSSFDSTARVAAQ